MNMAIIYRLVLIGLQLVVMGIAASLFYLRRYLAIPENKRPSAFYHSHPKNTICFSLNHMYVFPPISFSV
jgi:hypothetical protein